MTRTLADLEARERTHDPILRVARTLADLKLSERGQENHVREAIDYRTPDRALWRGTRGAAHEAND